MRTPAEKPGACTERTQRRSVVANTKTLSHFGSLVRLYGRSTDVVRTHTLSSCAKLRIPSVLSLLVDLSFIIY